MTGYELVFITTPTLSEDDLAVVLKKFKKTSPDMAENSFMNMFGDVED